MFSHFITNYKNIYLNGLNGGQKKPLVNAFQTLFEWNSANFSVTVNVVCCMNKCWKEMMTKSEAMDTTICCEIFFVFFLKEVGSKILITC